MFCCCDGKLRGCPCERLLVWLFVAWQMTHDNIYLCTVASCQGPLGIKVTARHCLCNCECWWWGGLVVAVTLIFVPLTFRASPQDIMSKSNVRCRVVKAKHSIMEIDTICTGWQTEALSRPDYFCLVPADKMINWWRPSISPHGPAKKNNSRLLWQTHIHLTQLGFWRKNMVA